MVQVFLGSFLACVGISVIFNISFDKVIYTSINGAIGYTLYCLLKDSAGIYTAMIVASFVMAVISEVLARKLKAPAIIFLVGALIPLVPGMSAYYTALYASKGLRSLALTSGMDTLLQAGAIVVGVSLATTIFKLPFAHKKK